MIELSRRYLLMKCTIDLISQELIKMKKFSSMMSKDKTKVIFSHITLDKEIKTTILTSMLKNLLLLELQARKWRDKELYLIRSADNSSNSIPIATLKLDLANLKEHLQRIHPGDMCLKNKLWDFNLQVALLLSITKIKEVAQSDQERQTWKTHNVSLALVTIVVCSLRDLSPTNITLIEELWENLTPFILDQTKDSKRRKTRPWEFYLTRKWSLTFPSLKKHPSKYHQCSCKNLLIALLKFKMEISQWVDLIWHHTHAPMLNNILANIFPEKPQMKCKDKTSMSELILPKTLISIWECLRLTTTVQVA